MMNLKLWSLAWLAAAPLLLSANASAEELDHPNFSSSMAKDNFRLEELVPASAGNDLGLLPPETGSMLHPTAPEEAPATSEESPINKAETFGPPDTVSPEAASKVVSADGTRICKKRSGKEIKCGWTKGLQIMMLSYHAITAADTLLTIECTKRPNCKEKNILLGDRPKTSTLIGFALGTAVLTELLMRGTAAIDTNLAKIFMLGFVGTRGLAVGLNYKELH